MGKITYPPKTINDLSLLLPIFLSLASLVALKYADVISNWELITTFVILQSLSTLHWAPISAGFSRSKSEKQVRSDILDYHPEIAIIERDKSFCAVLKPRCVPFLSFICSVVSFISVLYNVELDKLNPSKVKPKESIEQLTPVLFLVVLTAASLVLLLKFCVEYTPKYVEAHGRYSNSCNISSQVRKSTPNGITKSNSSLSRAAGNHISEKDSNTEKADRVPCPNNSQTPRQLRGRGL